MENIEDLEYERKLEQKKIKQKWVQYNKVYDVFIKEKIKMLYRCRWKAGVTDEISIKNANHLMEELNKFNKPKREPKYEDYFITITSTPDKDIKFFIRDVKKLFEIAVIQQGKLCFEQRGECESDLGKGVHAHMLVKRDPLKYTHSKFTERFLNKLVKLRINKSYNSKKQLLFLKNKECSQFSYQNIKKETVIKKLEYIHGQKNKEKLLKVKFDKLFRKKYKIEEIIEKKI